MRTFLTAALLSLAACSTTRPRGVVATFVDGQPAPEKTLYVCLFDADSRFLCATIQEYIQIHREHAASPRTPNFQHAEPPSTEL